MKSCGCVSPCQPSGCAPLLRKGIVGRDDLQVSFNQAQPCGTAGRQHVTGRAVAASSVPSACRRCYYGVQIARDSQGSSIEFRWVMPAAGAVRKSQLCCTRNHLGQAWSRPSHPCRSAPQCHPRQADEEASDLNLLGIVPPFGP